ncbi:MAG TPA: SRPBCC family protein [Candidatus Limnocylindrales bacterium]|nr:SRPBCC family protein [Candidatus Limnocylindrales bacterium]
MIRFSNTIDIAADSNVVFGYLVDLEHVPEWNRAIGRTEKLTPGSVRVGSRFRQARTVPRPGVEMIQIISLDPHRSFQIAGTLGPFQSRLSYEIEPVDGGTRVTNHVELDPPIPIGPLGDVLGARVRGAVAENLAVLKRLLEDPAARRS